MSCSDSGRTFFRADNESLTVLVRTDPDAITSDVAFSLKKKKKTTTALPRRESDLSQQPDREPLRGTPPFSLIDCFILIFRDIDVFFHSLWCCAAAAETRRLVNMNAARCSTTTVEVHCIEKLPVAGAVPMLAVTFTVCGNLSWKLNVFWAEITAELSPQRLRRTSQLRSRSLTLASPLGATVAASICDVFANLRATALLRTLFALYIFSLAGSAPSGLSNTQFRFFCYTSCQISG